MSRVRTRSDKWAEDALLDQFLAEGATHLGAAERELIASWKYRVSESFIVLKHLQKHSIFMNKDVFGVLGIYSPLADLIREVPAYVQTVLLPFGERIIIDGIVSSPGVQLDFGAGMRRVFEKQYAEARDRSPIRTSLLPTTARPTSESRIRIKRTKATQTRSSIAGTWRITQTELSDRDALDLFEDAYIRFGREQLGELAMIALGADVDYRLGTHDGRPRVDFSFEGDDDGDPCSGRGWATLDVDDVLRGRLYIHRGDDSAFEAKRVGTSPKRGRKRGGGG